MADSLKKKIHEGEIVDKPKTTLKVVEGEGVPKANVLEKEFKLKSEFFEKNVKLPEHSQNEEDGPITQVKVFRDSGVDVINPKNLKQFIKENKDIKQVVVEKVSIDEATRVSLLFEPKHHASKVVSLVEEAVDRVAGVESLEEGENKELERVFSLDELENLVNKEFLEEANKIKVVPTHDDLEKEKISKDSNSETPESEEGLKFKWPGKNKKLDEAKELDQVDESVENKKVSLKLKSDSEKSNKKVSYQKHTFTRKKNRSGHGYYYRAKDHVELFKVGSSFLKDFRSGLKSFSFSSIGLKEEREKSVLGILSFFNYHEDVRICVVTQSLVDSYYSRIATKAKKREAQVFDEDLSYEFYTGDGFEVIEYSELKKIERKISAYNFEDFLDFLLDSFDIILWDLPEIEILDANKEVYFPIVRSLDNVSFIVGKNVSKISEINEMISYFKRYQIAIKGLLFSDSTKKKGGDK
jgi:hypothetical protein